MRITLRDTFRSLRRLLGFMRGDRLKFLAGLVLSASDSMLFTAMSGVLLMLIFGAIETADRPAYGNMALILGAGVAAQFICIVLGGWLFRRAGVRSVARLRQALMDHVLSLPACWFGERHSGDVLSRLTADMQAAEQAMGWNIQFPVRAVISGCGSAVMMFVTDWRFSLVAIAIGILSVWAAARFAVPLKRLSDAVQAAAGRISERAGDLLAAATVLRIFNLGGWAAARMGAETSGAYKSAMGRARVQAGLDAVNMLSGWGFFVGLIMLGSVAVIRGWMSFGSLIGLVQFNGGLLFMFQALGGAFAQLQASLAGADRVYEMLDAAPEPASGTAPQPIEGAPAIELKDVSFSYEDGQEVLSDLSHTVRRGETVALVGGSGGGKSTVLKLLLGLHQAQAGSVALFGHPLGERWTSLRHAVAYVPQTCYLFSGTVRDNIAAGRPGASFTEVQGAARAAMAHDFILELPQGYDTEVGERGAELSGGQRQRIAIARALIKNAPLLLLDEATASLDSQSEQQVQRALETLMEGRTVIVVAHRLSTVRNADRILVLEGGRIVEQGSHDELMALGSRYAGYYRAQFEGCEALPA